MVTHKLEPDRPPGDPDSQKLIAAARGTAPAHADRELRAYLLGVPARGGTTEAVTDALREAILDGVLKPAEWLREGELADELRVSRTPVREALRRLADEGLAVKTAHQGTIVAAPTLDDVLALYIVRENLEGVAARLAAKHRTDDLVDRLAESQRRMAAAIADSNVPECEAENLNFHRILRDAATNPYLDRFLTQVEHAVRRLPMTTFAAPGRPALVLAEHQEILDRIRDGDGATAESAARKHMQAARNMRISMMIDM